MKKTLLLLERNLVLPMEKIASQRHLAAVRDGLLAVFPFSLIGSLFYLVTTIPIPTTWALHGFVVRHANIILVPYQMTTVLVTLYMVVSVGANLAKSYGLNQTSGSLVALASFLMTQVPTKPAQMVPQTFLAEAAANGMDTSWLQNLEGLGWVMPQTPMSGIGTYVGALSAILGIEVFRLCRQRVHALEKAKLWQKSQIPESVLQTLETVVPISIVVVMMFIIRDVIGFDFLRATLGFFGAMIRSVNSLPGALIFALIMSLLGFFGVIGFSVAGSAASITWAALLAANASAHAANAALPNVAPLPFFYSFIWIGGIGSTLSLSLIACFSKSRYLKKLGFGCLLPSLFNVNTPIIYGFPVILNPYMLIPFVLVPIVSTFVSYIFLWLNFVGRPFNAPANAIPFFASAFLSTGDFKAIILAFINFFISGLIYFPFFKLYEAKLMRQGDAAGKELALDKDKELKATTIE